jgi:hypothetical protein
VQAETMFCGGSAPGHEAARLVFHAPFWQLAGTAVFADAGEVYRSEYQVSCDSRWTTLHADVSGWAGSRRITRAISVNPQRRWRLDGRECAVVEGCADLDLSFSPATNLLAIRRLALPLGGSAQVRSAWLRFPEGTLEPLDQLYRRTGPETYHYESGGGAFSARAGGESQGSSPGIPGCGNASASVIEFMLSSAFWLSFRWPACARLYPAAERPVRAPAMPPGRTG